MATFSSLLQPLPITTKRAHFASRFKPTASNRRMMITCEAGKDDAFYMRRCVELARTAVGRTSPNPMVGCVIVRDGEVVGEGFHPKAGQPHAEVFALRQAGSLSLNATAYVSLEPCNHFGRTPPCTHALIENKVKRVVVGMTDPNPLVDSKGIEKLRGEGIEVVSGIEEELCRKLNEFFINRMVRNRPFVTLRYSTSMNGEIVNQINAKETQLGGYYSKLLQEYDGIILSSNFAKTPLNFPKSEEIGANQPFYIIIAKDWTSPLNLESITEEISSKVVVLSEKPVLIESQFDIETVVIENLNLDSVLEFCLKKGLCGVLADLREDESGDIRGILGNFKEGSLVNKVIIEWGGLERSSNLDLGFGLKSDDLKNLEIRDSSNGGVLIEGYLC
ncbi:hypothetical protein LUZ60_005056 [Juncus effusus]|nr:hypothetical protein LUZ60_005056 [Juncus effusus]